MVTDLRSIRHKIECFELDCALYDWRRILEARYGFTKAYARKRTHTAIVKAFRDGGKYGYP